MPTTRSTPFGGVRRSLLDAIYYTPQQGPVGIRWLNTEHHWEEIEEQRVRRPIRLVSYRWERSEKKCLHVNTEQSKHCLYARCWQRVGFCRLPPPQLLFCMSSVYMHERMSLECRPKKPYISEGGCCLVRRGSRWV